MPCLVPGLGEPERAGLVPAQTGIEVAGDGRAVVEGSELGPLHALEVATVGRQAGGAACRDIRVVRIGARLHGEPEAVRAFGLETIRRHVEAGELPDGLAGEWPRKHLDEARRVLGAVEPRSAREVVPDRGDIVADAQKGCRILPARVLDECRGTLVGLNGLAGVAAEQCAAGFPGRAAPGHDDTAAGGPALATTQNRKSTRPKYSH